MIKYPNFRFPTESIVFLIKQGLRLYRFYRWHHHWPQESCGVCEPNSSTLLGLEHGKFFISFALQSTIPKIPKFLKFISTTCHSIATSNSHRARVANLPARASAAGASAPPACRGSARAAHASPACAAAARGSSWKACRRKRYAFLPVCLSVCPHPYFGV